MPEDRVHVVKVGSVPQNEFTHCMGFKRSLVTKLRLLASTLAIYGDVYALCLIVSGQFSCIQTKPQRFFGMIPPKKSRIVMISGNSLVYALCCKNV